MATKYVFLDTNVLLHYRSLEEVDWPEVTAAESVTLILAPVVIRELDRHKDLHPNKKLRKRASGLAGRLSKLLDSGLDHDLRPGTRLHFEVTEPMVDFAKHHLRMDQDDDLLIASILQHRSEHPDDLVSVATADNGLKMKARHHGIEPLSLPDALKLPDEPDEDQKQIRDLQAKLAEYQDRAPKLRLVFPNEATRLEITRKRIEPLTEASLQQELEAQRSTLERPNPNLVRLPWFPPPSAEAEEAYKLELKDYIDTLEEHLRERQEARIQRARTVQIEVELLNEGRGPADDIDVFLKFPAGIEPSVDDPDPPEPEAPRPPSRPKSNLFEFVGMLQQVAESRPSLGVADALDRIGPSNISHPQVTTNESGSEVHVHVRRAKQNQTQHLGPLYVSFEHQDAVRSFKIKYTLQAADVPSDIEGELHVILKVS